MDQLDGLTTASLSAKGFRAEGLRSSRVLGSQRLPNPLIKEYTLN